MNDKTANGRTWFLYSPLFDRQYELLDSQRLAGANCPLDGLRLIETEFYRNENGTASPPQKTMAYFCYDCGANYHSIEPEALMIEARRRAEIMRTKLRDETTPIADLKRIVDSAEEKGIIKRL